MISTHTKPTRGKPGKHEMVSGVLWVIDDHAHISFTFSEGTRKNNQGFLKVRRVKKCRGSGRAESRFFASSRGSGRVRTRYFRSSRIGSGRVGLGRVGSGQEISKSRGLGRLGPGSVQSVIGRVRSWCVMYGWFAGRVTMTREFFSADPRAWPADRYFGKVQLPAGRPPLWLAGPKLHSETHLPFPARRPLSSRYSDFRENILARRIVTRELPVGWSRSILLC